MKLITKTDEEALMNYLKNLFEIPENIVSLQLTIGADRIPEISVKYYPNKNDKST